MKKNPRNYKRGGAMFAYILDSVYSDEIDTESMTDEGKIEFLLDTFYEEKFKDDRRRMCVFDLLREWLQGMPSAISVAFCYYYIAETGKAMGYCKDARSEARFINNWWGMLAYYILRLARIYKIDMSRFY
nr:MAG TPA: hypothetical protein [Caudoviricetes sp.]